MGTQSNVICQRSKMIGWWIKSDPAVYSFKQLSYGYALLEFGSFENLMANEKDTTMTKP